MVERRTTFGEGPSAHNQTSEDHSLDPNQRERQPSTEELLEGTGLDTMSVEEALDTSEEPANQTK
ncbi:MAG: hypothetical protein M3Q81_00415 [bacterium]|nr:hypothetical protein [bacterium]